MAVPNRADNKTCGKTDKDELEKRRLAERKEGHSRWVDPGALVECEPQGLAYVSFGTQRLNIHDCDCRESMKKSNRANHLNQ